MSFVPGIENRSKLHIWKKLSTNSTSLWSTSKLLLISSTLHSTASEVLSVHRGPHLALCSIPRPRCIGFCMLLLYSRIIRKHLQGSAKLTSKPSLLAILADETLRTREKAEEAKKAPESKEACCRRVWIYIEGANHGTAFNRPCLAWGICDPSPCPGPAELASVWALEDLVLARRRPMAV